MMITPRSTRTRVAIAAAFALTLSAPIAEAQNSRHGSLVVSDPWTRQTAPGQATGGGFLAITNRGRQADRLIGGASPAAARVEIHTMSMAGGVMRMRPVPGGLAIPAGGTLTLKPGGYHIMLIGLKAPLKLGTRVPLTLRFERAGPVKVQLSVKPIGHGTGGGHGHR